MKAAGEEARGWLGWRRTLNLRVAGSDNHPHLSAYSLLPVSYPPSLIYTDAQMQPPAPPQAHCVTPDKRLCLSELQVFRQ